MAFATVAPSNSARDALIAAMDLLNTESGASANITATISYDTNNRLDIAGKTSRQYGRYYGNYTLSPTIDSSSWNTSMKSLLPKDELLKANGSINFEMLINSEQGAVSPFAIRLNSITSNLAGSSADATYLVDGKLERLGLYTGRSMSMDNIRLESTQGDYITNDESNGDVEDILWDLQKWFAVYERTQILKVLSAGNVILVESASDGFTLRVNGDPASIDVQAMHKAAQELDASPIATSLQRYTKRISKKTPAQLQKLSQSYREWVKTNNLEARVRMQGNYISSYSITARGDAQLISTHTPDMEVQLSETGTLEYSRSFPNVSFSGTTTNISKLIRSNNVEARMYREAVEENSKDPFWRPAKETELLQHVPQRAWYRASLAELAQRGILRHIISPENPVYHLPWLQVIYSDRHPLPYPDELKDVAPYARLTKLQILEATTKAVAEEAGSEDFIAWAKQNAIVSNSFTAEGDGAKVATEVEAYVILLRTIKVYEQMHSDDI